MVKTTLILLLALTVGTTARAQGVAVNVATCPPVGLDDVDGDLPTAAELRVTIPISEKQAVIQQTVRQASPRTSLAEQARKIGLTLMMPEASLLAQTSRQPSQGLRRSTKVLIGTAIGAGIGVAVAAGLCGGNDCEPGPAAGAVVVLGSVGGGIGALVGFLASR